MKIPTLNKFLGDKKVFHPELKADGFISKEKFLVFFAPYLLGLISEILILTKSFDT